MVSPRNEVLVLVSKRGPFCEVGALLLLTDCEIQVFVEEKNMVGFRAGDDDGSGTLVKLRTDRPALTSISYHALDTRRCSFSHFTRNSYPINPLKTKEP